MKKKYELLKDDFIEVDGRKLYRIRALKGFGYVEKGKLGGYIEREENLSHSGNAWISGDARVYGDARVSGNAWVSGDARVYGDARVCDNAEVSGDARVSGNAWVSGNAEVYGDARVYGNAEVCDNAEVSGDARVSGNAWVSGNAEVYGDANITNNNDYCCFSCFGSANQTTTAYKTKDGHVEIVCGCFQGTIGEFAARVEETHGDNKHGREYKAIIEVIKAKFGINNEREL